METKITNIIKLLKVEVKQKEMGKRKVKVKENNLLLHMN